MKETFYFSHDYNARNDGKLVKVMMKHGVAGIGIYWCIVEMLYEEGGVLMLSECERIAFELRTSCEVVESIINDFDLFRNDKKGFYSKSILDRIEQRNIKSEKARNSAEKRWKDKGIDANALRTQSEGNAIKERKGKEIKEYNTEIVALQPNEYQESISFLKSIDIDNINITDPPDYARDYKKYWIEFILYWTEKSRNGKIRAEGEKTFETKRRFYTWLSRAKVQYEKPKQKFNSIG